MATTWKSFCNYSTPSVVQVRYRAANDRIIGVQGMNRKERGKKRTYPNSTNSSLIDSEELGTMTKISSQERCSPGRDLNPRPFEYKVGVLTARLQHIRKTQVQARG
jgi:hypothetical protein